MKRRFQNDRRRQDLPRSNRELLVRIEKPIYGGSFLARDEGKAVFVPLLLPGEQARVRVVEEKKSYAAAELVELVEGAAQRVTPGCRHFGVCGGCHYQHAEYSAQLEMKKAVLRESLERAGIRPPDDIAVLAGEPWRYRNRIRLAFDRDGRLGYRARRSHAVTAISECPIAASLLERAALEVAESLRKIVPRLPLTEMTLFCNAAETALLLTVFVSAPVALEWDAVAGEFHERVPELAGAQLALSGGSDEEALAPKVLAQWGAEFLEYDAGGFRYRVDHGAFFQVNRWLVDGLVECATGHRGGALAWDLFAGVGLFARKLAGRFDRVAAVESAPSSADALKTNLAGTTGQAVPMTTLEFLRKASRDERPDLVVVDPPRAGLGQDVCDLLLDRGSPELVYVSCDPATLARDLRLLQSGGYQIESATLADLFPQTFHLESIVRLRRG